MLKKWAFIFGFITFGLLLSPIVSKAESVTFTSRDSLEDYINARYGWIQVETDHSISNGDYFITEGTKFYTNEMGGIKSDGRFKRIKAQEFPITIDIAVGNWNESWFENTSLSVGGNITAVIQGNRPFYITDRNNEILSSFFVPRLPWEVAKVEQLEVITTGAKTTIVDGGILSTGLMVLAILLGVSLVPRLIYSFLR